MIVVKVLVAMWILGILGLVFWLMALEAYDLVRRPRWTARDDRELQRLLKGGR